MAKERLTDRLESLQEQILNLYEGDSKNLRDHILLWHLTRQENALLFAARQKNVHKIGLQVVPPTRTSRVKAEQAIMMELVLESLAKTNYGNEPWTLQETSLETYLGQPHHTLKKEPRFVDIQYDDSPDNATREVAWKWVYYQDADTGMWHKVMGDLIDSDGVYYEEVDGVRVYYIMFKDLLKKYGTVRTTMFTVKYGVKKINIAVASSHGRPATPVQPADAPDQPEAVPATRAKSPAQKKRTPPRDHSPAAKRAKPAQPRTPPTVSAGRRRRGRTPAAGRRRKQRKRGGSEPSSGPDKSTPLPPAAGEVGRVHTSVPATTTGRLRRLLLEARDPPLIVIKGPPNSVKCFRFRCNQHHRKAYDRVSTTWSWTNERGKGTAHVMFSFKSVQQRQHFVDTVKIPKTFLRFNGNFELDG